MNRKELIKKVSALSGLNLKQSESALIGVESAILGAVVDGDDIELKGIGKLFAKETNARTGRNPSTGGPVDIPAGRRVKFRVSKTLKDAL